VSERSVLSWHYVRGSTRGLTSAITPRLYFNYTETRAMKSKNGKNEQQTDGVRELDGEGGTWEGRRYK